MKRYMTIEQTYDMVMDVCARIEEPWTLNDISVLDPDGKILGTLTDLVKFIDEEQKKYGVFMLKRPTIINGKIIEGRMYQIDMGCGIVLVRQH